MYKTVIFFFEILRIEITFNGPVCEWLVGTQRRGDDMPQPKL